MIKQGYTDCEIMVHTYLNKNGIIEDIEVEGVKPMPSREWFEEKKNKNLKNYKKTLYFLFNMCYNEFCSIMKHGKTVENFGFKEIKIQALKREKTKKM